MLVMMDEKSFSGGESPQSLSKSVGKSLCSDRKHKRKENNKVSAQNSRKKQTERADVLHQEFQVLESSNTVLEKEIDLLRKEVQFYTAILQDHEPHCSVYPFSGPGTSPCAPVSIPAPVPAPAPPPVLAPVPDMADCWAPDHPNSTELTLILETLLQKEVEISALPF